MTPFRPSFPLRAKRWIIRILIIAALAMVSFVYLGRLVTHEDPLQRADAIYVLGGSWADRWLEAVDLERAGYAPLIVLSRDYRGGAELRLESEGIHVPTETDIARDIIVNKLHLPESALIVLPTEVDNTAQEAVAIRSVAAQQGWHRLIVITDRPSTRRAGFAMRRELGPSIEVIMRAPRTNAYDPDHWWWTRQEFRGTFYEVPKILAYWLGLRG